MSARTRTMAHLAKMLALAATSCSHEHAEPQAVTLPTPSSTASAPTASSTSRTTRKPPPLPVDDDDTITLRHPMHGSDPVGPPPPQYCVSVASTVTATATMHQGSGGFEVEVHVTLPASSGATFPASSNAQTIQVYGAIVVSASITATQAVVRGRLNMIADKANVRIFLPLMCPPGTGSLEVSLFYDRTAGTVKVDRIESR